MVGPVTAAPGVLRAEVEGNTPRPYDSAAHLRVLPATSGTPSWTPSPPRPAAPPPSSTARCPRPRRRCPSRGRAPAARTGRTRPECSRPDWGYPCKHAAALCYATAAHLDDGPFWLLQLCGRTKDAVLAALRTRRQALTGIAGESGETSRDQGVPGHDRFAFFSGVSLPPVPEPAEAASDEPPRRQLPLTTDPPTGDPFTLADLETLMRDTAQRGPRPCRRVHRLAQLHPAG